MAIELPINDISPLIDRTDSQLDVARQLHGACRNAGFFYIAGHGIAEDLLANLDHISRIFFDLEIEEKMAIRMELGGRAWRGYFPLEGEITSGKPDLKEGIYFGEELDETDPRVVSRTPLHGTNLFPSSPFSMKGVVLEYMKELTELGHHLMRGISLSLGLDESYFAERFTSDPLTLFRVFHYPPQQKSNQWGVGEHTDYGLLTILLQDRSGGLQVKQAGRWISAPPIAKTFICNIGDMLDRLTRGYYRSTPHRVLNTSGLERLSFPFFFDPGWDVSLEPVAIPQSHQMDDDQTGRWDGQSVHEFEGTYGEYLMGKVGKVFPDLSQKELRR